MSACSNPVSFRSVVILACGNLKQMIHIMQTSGDLIITFIRVIAGVIIFPYGMQKLFGWFDDLGGGVGIKASLRSFQEKKIPLFIAWLVILGQSIGSIMLLIGLAGRVAAFFNFLIFSGALAMHFSEGWSMNWTGKKQGEGIEYFIMLLALLLVVILKGSGGLSFDHWFFD